MKFLLPSDTPHGQRDAITADDDKITVEAGAGTGKTWVLSGRYARLLLENSDLLPSNILTLTYTEAAAGEMKHRIEERLRQELEGSDDYDRKREILEGMSDSWISTIHSFAARQIRESGLSLDIDPKASVITPQQEQDFWDSVREAAEFARLQALAQSYRNTRLESAAKSLDGDEYFSAAAAKWGADKLSHFAAAAAELHASSGRSWEEMLDWVDNDTLIDSARALVERITLPEWEKVWGIFSSIPPLPNPKTKDPESVGVIFNQLLESFRGRTPDKGTIYDFYTRITQAKSQNGNPFNALKPYLGGLTFGQWRDAQPKAIVEASQGFYDDFTCQELRMRKTLLKFCATAWGIWDIMKSRRGLLSFSDMILHAKRSILSGGGSRKFSHILVDEFQDTDPLQYAMINSLVDDTKFFAVGDPKQSIYKFRHADPSLFARTIRESDKRITLGVSFRTRKTLLDKINRLFSSIWADGLGQSKAMSGLKYEALDPVSDTPERNSGTMPDFRIFLAEHNSRTTQQARKNLADTLAKNISDWVNDGLTIWDKKQRIIRPVKFSDFAILAPNRNIYPVLEESLSKFGIKSIQDKSTDYFARGEIADIVCTLRAAADVNDEFSLMGWLMSPFSGVSEDDAVKTLAITDKTHRPSELIRQNFPEAYSRLEYLALIGETEGPAGVIEAFDRDRSWLSGYRPDDRMRVLRNLRLAVSIARNFQQSGNASLTACAEWLTRSVRNGVSFEEPAWHDDGENAVRLGTVHSAKGLEYPVTVVFEHRVQKRSETESLRPSRELGLAFINLPDEVKGDLPDDFKPKLAGWEKLLSEQGDAEEAARLFYVAATRAQDSLIFCGLVKEDGEPHDNTWTKLLLDNDHETDREFAGEVLGSGSENHEEAQALKFCTISPAKNSLRQISASSFALFEWCPFAWRRSYKQGLTLTWQSPAEDSDSYDGRSGRSGGSGGAELGSLAHWVLARWPKGDDWEKDLRRWLYDREVLPKMPGWLRDAWRHGDKDSLFSWLENFAASPLGEILRTRTDIQRERRFRVKLNDSTTLAGAIDALYGNSVVDYKITSIDRTPPGLYESQLDFYALVVHELTGAETVNTDIAFLRENTFAHREISEFGAIRERVIEAASVCASGPFVPKKQHCGACPFKKGCVKNNAGVQE